MNTANFNNLTMSKEDLRGNDLFDPFPPLPMTVFPFSSNSYSSSYENILIPSRNNI